jgi:hypothetical protein
MVPRSASFVVTLPFAAHPVLIRLSVDHDVDLVDDGRGGEDKHMFNLTVVDANDRPILTTSPPRTTLEDEL